MSTPTSLSRRPTSTAAWPPSGRWRRCRPPMTPAPSRSTNCSTPSGGGPRRRAPTTAPWSTTTARSRSSITARVRCSNTTACFSPRVRGRGRPTSTPTVGPVSAMRASTSTTATRGRVSSAAERSRKTSSRSVPMPRPCSCHPVTRRPAKPSSRCHGCSPARRRKGLDMELPNCSPRRPRWRSPERSPARARSCRRRWEVATKRCGPLPTGHRTPDAAAATQMK